MRALALGAFLPAVIVTGAALWIGKEYDHQARIQADALDINREAGRFVENVGLLGDIAATASVSVDNNREFETQLTATHGQLDQLIARVGPQFDPAIVEQLSLSIEDLSTDFANLLGLLRRQRDLETVFDDIEMKGFEDALSALLTIAYNSDSQELIANISTIEKKVLNAKLKIVWFRSDPSEETMTTVNDALKELRDAVKRARSTFRSDGNAEAKALFAASRTLQKAWGPAAEAQLAAAAASANIAMMRVVQTNDSIKSFSTQIIEAKNQQSIAFSQRVETIKLVVMGFVISTTLLVAILVVLLTRTLSGSFKTLGSGMQRIANDDLDFENELLNRQDDVGKMARSLEILKENAISRRKARKKEERRLAEERQEALDDAKIQKEVATVVAAVARGDFSKRLHEPKFGSRHTSLVSGINDVTSMVETTTRELSIMFRALADGNLFARIDSNFEGVFAELKDDANSTAEKLQELVSEIVASSGEVRANSNSLVEGADELARWAESQETALAEVDSTMEALSAFVKANETNGEVAQSLVANAEDGAVRGAKVAGNVSKAMTAIEESTSEVSAVTQLVDSIAFQTNLLALNASVEAARAGDAGSGFAVVASEVRTLAHRSSEAASQINDLVNQSSDHVKSGVELVKVSVSTLDEIKSQMIKLVDTISSITQAGTDQSEKIREVSSSINSLSQVTQRNTSMAAASKQKAVDLSFQADRLSSAVALFDQDNLAAQHANAVGE